MLLDEQADFARRLAIRGVPTNVFVDERGIVCAVGASTFDRLVTEARRLEPGLAAEDVALANRVPDGFDPGQDGP